MNVMIAKHRQHLQQDGERRTATWRAVRPRSSARDRGRMPWAGRWRTCERASRRFYGNGTDSYGSTQECGQFFGIQAAGGVAAIEELLRKFALAAMEVHDLLFDRTFRDQPVDGHRSRLTDAVGTIRGLVLHCGIPPRVHVDDVVRGGQVQAEAARLERNEKDIAIARLERVDALRPLLAPGCCRPGTGSPLSPLRGALRPAADASRTARRPAPCGGSTTGRPRSRQRSPASNSAAHPASITSLGLQHARRNRVR